MNEFNRTTFHRNDLFHINSTVALEVVGFWFSWNVFDIVNHAIFFSKQTLLSVVNRTQNIYMQMIALELFCSFLQIEKKN